jgi:hypothetical protein
MRSEPGDGAGCTTSNVLAAVAEEHELVKHGKVGPKTTETTDRSPAGDDLDRARVEAKCKQ